MRRSAQTQEIMQYKTISWLYWLTATSDPPVRLQETAPERNLRERRADELNSLLESGWELHTVVERTHVILSRSVSMLVEVPRTVSVANQDSTPQKEQRAALQGLPRFPTPTQSRLVN